jgi:ADP-ribosylglycohydrolase
MRGGGLGPYQPGEWSDDTQMAACIAQVAATGIDLATDEALDQIARAFLKWAAEGASDMGVQTSAVLSRAREGAGPAGRRMAEAARGYASSNPRSAGNGALMRTSIVGISALHDPEATAAAARAVAELTHADPLAGDSCVLWCEAIRVAVMTGELNVRAGIGLVPADRRNSWLSWLDDADEQPAASFSPNGFTVTALQAAWAAIRTPHPADDPAAGSFAACHFQDALHAAVRIGNDTDTVAAIAGGLLGAKWGASAVPAAWRSALHGWPELRARDLVALAAMTAAGGRPDHTGWPMGVDILYPTVAAPTVPVAHPYDAGVTLGTVWPSEHETDVVVSLCRVGSRQAHLPSVPAADHLDVWLIDRSEAKYNPHLAFVLVDTAAYVAAERERGRRVFVHCVAAQQRTPSVALAYAALGGQNPAEARTAIMRALPSTRGQGRMWDAAAHVRTGRSNASSSP